MTNNNAIATTKMNTGAPPLMAKLSLFPVSKPNASYIERTNGRETVRITPSRPEEWVYGKTPRLIFLYVQSMIRMKNNPTWIRTPTLLSFVAASRNSATTPEYPTTPDARKRRRTR